MTIEGVIETRISHIPAFHGLNCDRMWSNDWEWSS